MNMTVPEIIAWLKQRGICPYFVLAAMVIFGVDAGTIKMIFAGVIPDPDSVQEIARQLREGVANHDTHSVIVSIKNIIVLWLFARAKNGGVKHEL